MGATRGAAEANDTSACAMERDIGAGKRSTSSIQSLLCPERRCKHNAQMAIRTLALVPRWPNSLCSQVLRNQVSLRWHKP